MNRFLDSIRRAVADHNWYAALSTALTIPDICGRLEAPTLGSQARYVAWYNRFLLPTYTRPIGPDRTQHVFLSGDDCYALRCSYLHEGSDTTINQRARQALERFHFVAPKEGWSVHRNQSDQTLQLQVDTFCEEMCSAADAWIAQVAAHDRDIQARLAGLLVIHSLEGGFTL